MSTTSDHGAPLTRDACTHDVPTHDVPTHDVPTHDVPTHDVIVVGAGVSGALVAKRLTDAGLRVLILEAGPDTTSSYADYLDHIEQFFGAAGKGPESPWSPAVAAPQPDTADLRTADQHAGYFVQTGPQLYASSYTRVLGGSTMHWLGVCLRMLPEDFQMKTRYGVAVDWPIGYDDLEPWYRDAEWQIGVSADVADQAHLGVTFLPGYDYPMRRIPPSWSDQLLATAVDGTSVQFGSTACTLKIRSYPAARNSIPRGDYVPVGAVDVRPDGQALGHELGQRCAGNTACTPICPIQAKYNAGKTLAQAAPVPARDTDPIGGLGRPGRSGQRCGHGDRIPALRRPDIRSSHPPRGHRPDVCPGRPCGRERQAAIGFWPGRPERPARAQSHGSSLPLHLGLGPGRHRRVPGSAVDGRARRLSGRRVSRASTPPSVSTSATTGGGRRPERRTPPWRLRSARAASTAPGCVPT